jgi:copper chaperone CopZ
MVDGMHCGACVALIEESLAEQDGVLTASVDLDSARAVVSYDPAQLGVDDLLSTIAEAGYSAMVVG